MSGLSPAEVQSIRDNCAARVVQLESRRFHERGLHWYGEVHPSVVLPAKRRAAEELLAKLAKSFRSRPSLTWFSRLNDDERRLVEDDAYPFKAFRDGHMLGFCSEDRRTVALLVDLESPQLLHILAHEFAHHLGVEDEDECDAFARNCLEAG